MLIVIYLFNVIVVGYIIFALERAYGTCMDYRDVIWMMGQGFQRKFTQHKLQILNVILNFAQKILSQIVLGQF